MKSIGWMTFVLVMLLALRTQRSSFDQAARNQSADDLVKIEIIEKSTHTIDEKNYDGLNSLAQAMKAQHTRRDLSSIR